MGYYTNFTLDLSLPNNYARKDELLDALKRLDVFDDMGGSLVDQYWAYAKWYDCEQDLRRISAEFKMVLFTLWGDGEDSEDFWVEYYKNGKCQHCSARLIYEDYDPEKMV